jgi:hypothetical protein
MVVYTPRRGYGQPRQDQCAAGVMSGFHYSQCSRKPSVQEDGHGWCKQHAPSIVAERDAKRNAEWEAKWAKKMRGWEINAARNAIAETAIKHFRQQATFDELEAAVMAYEKLVEAKSGA